MPVFRKDVRIIATAYVKAASVEEADRIIAERFTDNTAELPVGEGVEISISGRMFDDPRLPDVSLSPAITLDGTYSDLPAENVDE